MAAGLLNGTLVPLSGDKLIDAMTNGYKWQLGPNRNIDWSISNGWRGEYWNNPTEVVAKFSLALSVISYYANVKFTYTGYFFDPLDANLSGSDINLALDSGYIFGPDTNTWAMAEFPNPNDVDRGDIYLNINSLANSISYEPGTAGWFLLLHEIGHTLGLKHPHDDGGTGRPTFSQLGWSDLDIDLMTMMSYADDYNFNLAAFDPATPMILDVLALQYLYGKNMLTNAGDSRFILTNTSYYETLWDASGIDVIDQSGASEGWYIVLPNTYVSSLVDTKAGFAMPMASVNLTSPRSLYWLAGDFENVIGSPYSDQIYLSSMNNVVDGGGGLDTVFLTASRSQCTITFSSGRCIITSSGGGTDTLSNVEYIGFSDGIIAVTALNITADKTAPAFTSATTSADGLKVILTYNEPLSATTAAKTAFAVKVAGVAATVNSVAVNGSTVELTLANSIGAGQAVTVGYKAPTASAATTNAAVQDTGGNDAATLAATTAVTNISTADKTAPAFTSATTSADGLKVILTYNEPLSATTAAKTAFAVKVAGVAATVNSVAVNGSTVELTLATAVQKGQAVTVGYKAPTASAATTNAAVQDTGGNDAVTLVATTSVTNISTVDTIAPTVSSIAYGANDGKLSLGETVTLTVTLSEAVAVTGTPTLALANGGTATYTGGTGTNALTFSFTPGAGQTTADLATAASNALTGTITDLAGNAVTAAGFNNVNPTGTLAVDVTPPTVSSIAHGINDGKLALDETVTLTVTLSEAVAVTGTPTLALANGGTATYTGGTGTNALTFSYTPGAGQTTADLATAASNALTGTITDLAGNAVTAAGFNNVNPTGTLAVDVTPPTVSSIAYGTNDGALALGEVVTLTVTLSEAVNVTGTPTLALANGGTATYTGGTGTSTLSFRYTPAAGQTTADLATAASNALNGTIKDLAGNAVAAAGFDNVNPTGTLVVDAAAPTFTSATTSADGLKVILTYNEPLSATTAAKTAFAVKVAGVAATVNSVAVNGSTVELTLANSIGAGQAVTVGYKAPTASAATTNAAVQDTGGNDAATLAATTAVTNISTADKTAPAFTSATTSADGLKVILTYNEPLSATTAAKTAFAVKVDGVIATISSVAVNGSTVELTLATSIGAGQAVTVGYKAPTASAATTNAAVQDTGGNDAVTLAATTTVTNNSTVDKTAPNDNTPPTVSSISYGTNDGALSLGEAVTLTITLSEAVNVTGTPTLALANGGTATYTGGTGTNTLTFSYTLAAGQTTADLATAVSNALTGTIVDLAGNAVTAAGFNNVNPTGTLAVDVTAPTVSTSAPAGGATGITGGVNIALTFSEAIARGTGTITLRSGSATGTIEESFDAASSNRLTLSGSTLTIDPTSDLSANTRYFVVFTSGNIKDIAGNAYAGTSTYDFITGDTVAPTVSSISYGTNDGAMSLGEAVTLTVTLSEAVNVTGTPTLALANGGTATYTGGTGTNALTFSYTASAGQTTADLATAERNALTGNIKDIAGNAVTAAGFSNVNPTGTLAVDVTAPAVSTFSPTDGSTGITVGSNIVLTFFEAIALGTGNITLRAGSATGTIVESFDAATSNRLILSGSTLTIDPTSNLVPGTEYFVVLAFGNIQDIAGNSYAGSSTYDFRTGPSVSSIIYGTNDGRLALGEPVLLIVTLSEAVAVTDTATIALANGGTATYIGGSGTTELTFVYTPAAGQATADLATAANAFTGIMTDFEGNTVTAVTTAGFNYVNPTGTLAVDVTAPKVASIAYGTNDGALALGETVTLTVTMSEAVIVTRPAPAGGTPGIPTLALANGGTAMYIGGSGTPKLTFSYTPADGQTTSDLATAADAFNDLMADLAGNQVTLSGFNNVNPPGTLAVDTTAPKVKSIAYETNDGSQARGETVGLIVTMSEAVIVRGGTLTLALANGGTATWIGQTNGLSSQLKFQYTAAFGQSTADLATAVSNALTVTGTFTDFAGNTVQVSGFNNINPTGILAVDTEGPAFTSATTSENGLKVILTYNEPLHATTAAMTAFAVGVAGFAATVSSVAVNGSTIELTLAKRIERDQAVTVFYTAPATDVKQTTANAAVQDLFGNDAPTIATEVTNISTVDTKAPTVSTFSPTDGLTGVAFDKNIVLTFSEAIARGTGNITLRSGSATGDVVESFDAATSNRLILSGSTLTIDPTNNLSANTQYFVVFTSGNIKDTAGNAYTGISTYDFRTVNIVNGTANNDTLTGTVNVDIINGLAGDDIITGGAGKDNMDGGEGSDLYIVAASTDHAAAEFTDTGASGTDEVRFTSTTSGTLRLYAGDTGIEKVVIGTGTAAAAVTTTTPHSNLHVDASLVLNGLSITGNDGGNEITGTDFADYIWGYAGEDYINGGPGNDSLYGGNDRDQLTGGDGADWFIFDTAPTEFGNTDRITDFTSGTDKLVFSKAIFTGLSGAGLGDLSSDAFWSGAGITTAHDADDRFIYNTTNGYLYYDADGNASGSAAVLVAMLGATTPLNFTDLQIIG